MKLYYSKGIKYTEEFLHGKANIDSFSTVREERLLNSSFLWTWTGFRQAIPLNLHIHLLSVLFLIAKTLNVVTTRFLIKCNYEKPKKWAKLREEFDLEDQHIEKGLFVASV